MFTLLMARTPVKFSPDTGRHHWSLCQPPLSPSHWHRTDSRGQDCSASEKLQRRVRRVATTRLPAEPLRFRGSRGIPNRPETSSMSSRPSLRHDPLIISATRTSTGDHRRLPSSSKVCATAEERLMPRDEMQCFPCCYSEVSTL